MTSIWHGVRCDRVSVYERGRLRSHFESMSDPRHRRNRYYLLVDIIVFSIRSIICNANDPYGNSSLGQGELRVAGENPSIAKMDSLT